MPNIKLGTLYYELTATTNGLDAVIARSEQSIRGIGDKAVPALNDTSASVSGLTKAFRGLAAAAAAYKVAEYTNDVIGLADKYSELFARLGLVTHGTENLNHVYKELFALSQDTRTGLESNVALYTSLARATSALGLTQTQLLSITKTVAQAFKVSGASTSETENAVRQLSQAMASGVLRGDEFNSIAENAPRLQKAVADSLGVTIGKLRQLAADGKITAEIVSNALLKAGPAISQEFAKIPETVGGALIKVNNALLQYVGLANSAGGETHVIASALDTLATNFDEAARAGVVLATVFAGRYLGQAGAAVSDVAKGLASTRAATIAAAESTAKAALIDEAYTEDRLRTAQANVKLAETEVSVARQRLADVTATQAAIVAERELQTARLNTANPQSVRAAGQLAQPGLAVLGGAAVAREEQALADAEQRRIAATRELVLLGGAQTAQGDREIVELAALGKAHGEVAVAEAIVAKETLAVKEASAVATVAQAELTTVTKLSTSVMGTAGTAAKALWTAMGGWIGVGLLAIVGIYEAITGKIADAKKKQEELNESVGKFAVGVPIPTIRAELQAIQLAAKETQERLDKLGKFTPDPNRGPIGAVDPNFDQRNALQKDLINLKAQEAGVSATLATAITEQNFRRLQETKTLSDAEKEYEKKLASGKNELALQKELATAYGTGKDALEEITAAFALKGKLAQIDIDYSGKQATALKNVVRATAELEKAQRERARIDEANQKEDEQDIEAFKEREKLDVAIKKAEQEQQDALEAFNNAQLIAHQHVDQELQDQLDQIALLKLHGKALDDFTDKLLYQKKLQEFQDQGLSFTDASGAARDFVKNARAIADATSNTKGWANELERVVSIAQLIGSALAAAGSEFGKSIAEAATGLQSVLGGAKDFAKGDVINGAGKIAGGLITIAQSLDLFGTQAKERANKLRDAALAFNRALDAFGSGNKTALQGALATNLSNANTLANQAGTSVGFSSNANFASADEIKTTIANLRAAGAEFNKQSKGAGNGALALADALQKVYAATVKTEAEIRAAIALEIAGEEKNLQVRALVSAGRLDEAQAMRDQIARQKELDDATAKYGDTDAGRAYIQHLKDVQVEEQKAADVAAHDPLKNFESQAKAFGLAGADYLDGLIAATKKKFGEIADQAVDGIDLSTQDGLKTLHDRIDTLWTKFNEDGVISDSEQAIIDSLGAIYSTALELFDSIDKRVERSLSAASEANGILGGDAREQFGRTADASKGFSADIDKILAGADISTTDGAKAVQAQLRALYKSITADGVTDEEKPIIEIIKSLFSGVVNAIDEGVTESQKEMSDNAASRNQKRNIASRDISINDESGIDAFKENIHGLTPALSSFFDQFDVTNTEGISKAKDGIKGLAKEIDGLTDEEILAKFGVTRDELNGILVDVNGGLNGLNDGLKTTAQNAIDAANQLKDFNESTHDAFLRASGNDRQADLDAATQDTAKKLQTAKDLHASQQVIDEITQTGQLKIKDINKQYDDKAAQAAQQNLPSSVTAASSATSTNPTSFSASSVTSITELQGRTIVDINLQQLARLGSIDSKISAFLTNALGALPGLQVPALPRGFGAPNGASNSANAITLIVNISGPITGTTPEDVARRFSQSALPYIDAAIARGAGIQAKINGTPLA